MSATTGIAPSLRNAIRIKRRIRYSYTYRTYFGASISAAPVTISSRSSSSLSIGIQLRRWTSQVICGVAGWADLGTVLDGAPVFMSSYNTVLGDKVEVGTAIRTGQMVISEAHLGTVATMNSCASLTLNNISCCQAKIMFKKLLQDSICHNTYGRDPD